MIYRLCFVSSFVFLFAAFRYAGTLLSLSLFSLCFVFRLRCTCCYCLDDFTFVDPVKKTGKKNFQKMLYLKTR